MRQGFTFRQHGRMVERYALPPQIEFITETAGRDECPTRPRRGEDTPPYLLLFSFPDNFLFLKTPLLYSADHVKRDAEKTGNKGIT